MPASICSPVLKYSSATGVRPDRTIPWTHTIALNLFVIIEEDGELTMDGKLVMRVVKGTEVLESVNISDRVRDALEAGQMCSQSMSASQFSQLPLFGMTKDSSLAIQHRLRDGQIGRLQLRMKTPHECQAIVRILKLWGVQFQEQRAIASGHGAAKGPTGVTQAKLVVMPTVSPHTSLERICTDSYRTENLVARAPNGNSEGNASSAGKFKDSFVEEQNSPQIQTLSSGFREASIHERYLPAIREQSPRPASANQSYSTTSAQSSSTIKMSNEDHRRAIRTAPQTTALIVTPDTLEHEIPPRRELPFNKSDKTNSSNRSSSRPSSAISLPPLPSPHWVNGPNGCFAKPASGSQHAWATDAGSNTVAIEVAGTTGQKVTSHKGGVMNSAATRPSRMNELLYGKQSSTERLLQKRVMGANHREVADTQQQPKPVQCPVASSEVGQLQAEKDPIRRPHDALRNIDGDASDTALRSFALQSQEDRLAVLDEFMVAHLESPSFLQLCEDVDRCWRRIALGL